jgi:beta-glucosidase-like glycosyl hydrolase
VLNSAAYVHEQVCRDPRWGRCYESYSEDHRIVQSMTELIPGLQGEVPEGFTSGMPYVAGKYDPVQEHFCHT